MSKELNALLTALLADKGFAGKEFQQLTEQMGLTLLRPDRKDETYTNGNPGGIRQ